MNLCECVASLAGLLSARLLTQVIKVEVPVLNESPAHLEIKKGCLYKRAQRTERARDLIKKGCIQYSREDAYHYFCLVHHRFTNEDIL